MNHIISIMDPENAWCGKLIEINEQSFKTIDQAAINGLFPAKKPVCKECITLCIQSLLNNIEAPNDD